MIHKRYSLAATRSQATACSRQDRTERTPSGKILKNKQGQIVTGALRGVVHICGVVLVKGECDRSVRASGE